MKHYGDLEKYLGTKYAKEVSDDENLTEVYEESRAILNSELDAMAIMNQAWLAVKSLKKATAYTTEPEQAGN